MSPSRHDIYAPIHKGLRACLAHTLTTLGRSDFSDADETLAAGAALRELLAFCSAHLRLEEQFIHPALETGEPGCTAGTTGEHQAHLATISALEAALIAIESESAPQRPALARALYRQLAVFVAENLEHMDAEECEHNPRLWQRHTDEEIRALEARQVSSLSPTESARALRWMLPNLNHGERAALLLKMRAAAPAAAFQGVMDSIEPLLSRRERARLVLALDQ